jgi:hypothetical protein
MASSEAAPTFGMGLPARSISLVIVLLQLASGLNDDVFSRQETAIPTTSEFVVTKVLHVSSSEVTLDGITRFVDLMG